jgi:hypothetical protein
VLRSSERLSDVDVDYGIERTGEDPQALARQTLKSFRFEAACFALAFCARLVDVDDHSDTPVRNCHASDPSTTVYN